MFTRDEIKKVEVYLQDLFKNQNISIKEGNGNDAPAEVFVSSEFVGVVYKNVDEGEVSYDFNMSILPDDL